MPIVALRAFELQLHPAREHLVLEVSGELDLATVPQVRDAASAATLAGFKSLIVDLRGVDFMDSAGVHLLRDLRSLESDGVRCRMIEGRLAVQRVLELTGDVAVLPAADPASLVFERRTVVTAADAPATDTAR